MSGPARRAPPASSSIPTRCAVRGARSNRISGPPWPSRLAGWRRTRVSPPGSGGQARQFMPRLSSRRLVWILQPRVGSEPVTRCRDADHDIAQHAVGSKPALTDKRSLETSRTGYPQDSVDAANRGGRKRRRADADIQLSDREVVAHIPEAAIRPPGRTKLADATWPARHDARSPRPLSVARKWSTSSAARVWSMP